MIVVRINKYQSNVELKNKAQNNAKTTMFAQIWSNTLCKTINGLWIAVVSNEEFRIMSGKEEKTQLNQKFVVFKKTKSMNKKQNDKAGTLFWSLEYLLYYDLYF